MQSLRFRQIGFSLLEMLVALAIASILLGFAIPSLQSFSGSSEITATNNQFVYSLQSARSEAIKRSIPVGLCPSANPMVDEPVCGGGNYANGWIVFVDSDGSGSRSASDEVILQSEAVSPAFTFTADLVFADRIYFNESGTSINPAGVPLSGDVLIDYKSGGELRDVSIAANGRISTHIVGGTLP